MEANKDVLLIFGAQVDYLPLGLFAIPNTDLLFKEISIESKKYEQVILIQEWFHPQNEVFAANHLWRRPNQTIDLNNKTLTLWETHCIRNSFGSMLAPAFKDFEAEILQIQTGEITFNSNFLNESQLLSGAAIWEKLENKSVYVSGILKEEYKKNGLPQLKTITKNLVIVQEHTSIIKASGECNVWPGTN